MLHNNTADMVYLQPVTWFHLYFSSKIWPTVFNNPYPPKGGNFSSDPPKNCNFGPDPP